MNMIFAILAVLCFAADAASVSFGRLNIQSLGLLFLTLAMLVRTL